MKRRITYSTLCITLAVLLLAGGTVRDVYAASANGQANAIVLTDLTVFQTRSLDFGDFVPGVSGGTVAIDRVTGTTSSTGSVVMVENGINGQFQVNGPNGAFLVFATIPSGQTLKVTSGANEMSFTLNQPFPGAQFLTAGQASFLVGGTLTVNPNQPAGSYQGTYEVSVNFF